MECENSLLSVAESKQLWLLAGSNGLKVVAYYIAATCAFSIIVMFNLHFANTNLQKMFILEAVIIQCPASIAFKF